MLSAASQHHRKQPQKRSKRYLATENKILTAVSNILKRRSYAVRVTNAEVIREAGITRAAFYLHYRGVDEVLETNTEIVLQAVRTLVQEHEAADVDLRRFLRQLLILVHQNQMRFEIEHNRESVRLWRLLLAEDRPVLTRGWLFYGAEKDDVRYQQFGYEFIGIIAAWENQKFCKTGIDQCLNRLAKLTVDYRQMRGEAPANSVVPVP